MSTNNNIPAPDEAPALVCPVCGKSFDTVQDLSTHISAHAVAEQARKDEDEKKARREQRQADWGALTELYARMRAAEKQYNKAYEEYQAKYNGPANDFFASIFRDWL